MASTATAGHQCPSPMKPTSNGVFQGDNPLDFSLPLIILQICLVFVLTRALAYPLRRLLRQPRVIAEIIGGILLGPSALGRNAAFLNRIFPRKSLTVLDTLANLGLLFFLFLVGLELDLKSIRQTRKKAVCIALSGITLPFVIGIGVSFVLRQTISPDVKAAPLLVFMGVALSITAFPVLARILAELKLLTTDVGRMAMSAAAINDVAAWILLALAIALSGTGRSPLTALWVLLAGSAFIICCALIVPRVFKWMAQRCPEGEPVNEMYVCATLATVLAAAFCTDAIGIHALFGAFVIGILIPKDGPFAGALVEKVEDLVSGLFLPLYFVSSGLKTDITTIQGAQSWGLLVLVIATACIGKILGTLVVSLLCRIPFREAITLGFLMNTKGLVELIVLNIGKDRKVLNDQTFAICVLMAIFTTFITTPIVVAIYKPAKQAIRGHKRRTIERKDPDSQLRIMTCFHSQQNIPTMLNLIEASRGTEKREGVWVYALHLMELSERPSAILMAHKARKNGLPFSNKLQQSDTNQLVVAFEAFRQLSRVIIRPMTAISALHNIHEDICASAERKKAAMIILPFHKHQRIDGSLETIRNEFRCVNKRVLDHSPCSVGILVDRGLGGGTHVSASNVSSAITILFFGGNDDREALAYGARMAEHPGISVTLVHCIAGPEIAAQTVTVDINDDRQAAITSETADKMVLVSIRKLPEIKIEERIVNSGAEIVEAVKEFSRCNLFVVGRMPDGPAAAVLTGREECPELGPVGNLLTSHDLSTSASVLVVQQYNSAKSRHVSSTEIAEVPEGDSETV
ncbi:cation/H(+) antiporter 18-like [Mercurialis annua]|uniref:cation/H(+) antiporter 18-like n=1 Tax=Mercurialis annua TaxID=3986 RepID=UPI0021602E9D|nr:cation/H(+) antiporter 18-like [Mercurialis annua]